ncbi:MAG: hypothetical protein J6C23_08120, partial [Clostridia bacterium]|nr:hypothetical protein [Clostridia bacterium]
IVLKMKTSAGNEYMNLSAGDGFTVQLLATQLASEEDSFDNSYDNGAEYDPLEAYPIAKVEKIPTKDASGNDIVYSVANGDIIHSGNWNGLMLEDNISLDTAYKFTAVDVDDDVKYTKYGKWDADFEVSVDRLVEIGTLGLAGNYGGYGWIGFLSPVNLAANEPIRLLESAGFDVTYEDVVETVKEFSCGAWIEGSALAGSTITVALKLYDPESTDVIVAGKYSYTFPAIEDAPVAELKTYTDAEVAAIQNSLSTEGMSLSGFNGTPTFATDDVEIVSLYSFRPAETDEEVENSPYKDWNAEFVVVFNNEVPTGSIGLMGSYADIPWVYFALPDVSDSCDGVAANEPVLLMSTAAQIAGFTGFGWTYQDICAGMDSFECGVFVNTDSTNTYADLPAGTTITVELRLYNPAVADGSDYITIQSVTQNLN